MEHLDFPVRLLDLADGQVRLGFAGLVTSSSFTETDKLKET